MNTRKEIYRWTCGLLLLLTINAAPIFACGATHGEWGYSGDSGPEHWGALKPEYSACASGKNQSPIDLNSIVEADLPPLNLHYEPATTEILNNGHTVQVNFAPGNILSVDNIHFELKQIHFHTPSENHIGGKPFPMEAHLVHADSNGQLAVIALMYVEGKENPFLATAWKAMPTTPGDKKELKAEFGAGLLPAVHDYYRFNGSLTTPPCTEGVRWIVMSEMMEASAEQIQAFRDVMKHPNNRPIQQLNARLILK